MSITKTTARRRFVTLTAAVLVIGMVSVAAAAWLADGSGTGTVTATTADGLDLAFDEEGIYPNGEFDVTVTVTNTNDYNVSVESIDLSDESDAISTTATGCTDAGISWSGEFTFAADTEVVGANDSLDIVLEDAVVTDNDLEDDCQGAIFDIDIVMTGASTAADATS